MDAWLSGGASSAAVAGEAAEEAQHSTQAMDSDDGEHATDDVDAIVNVSVSGGHNGYLLCGEYPNRPHAEFGGHAGEETGSCELLSDGPHKGRRSGAMPQV